MLLCVGSIRTLPHVQTEGCIPPRISSNFRTSPPDAKRLREFEAENAKLKKLLTEAHLDMHALKSVLGVKR